MKFLKRVLLLCFALVLSLAFGITLASCNGGNNNNSVSEEEPDTDAYVYRVSVINETGFGFDGVTVNLYEGDTKVSSKKTNSNGNANFLSDDVELGNYTVKLSNLPDGYELIQSEDAQTVPQTGLKIEILIRPTGLLEGPMPTDARYSLGDVIHDFTVTTTDNVQYTLSEVLAEKRLVLINFWSTNCGPCTQEFPAMHNAATLYSDTVSVLALGSWAVDTQDAVKKFKADHNYTAFNMVSLQNGNDMQNNFSVSAVPHTVMIDRYGVVVYNHVGAMTSYSDFTTQFDKFVGDDYIPTVVGSATEDNEGEDTPTTYIEPTEEVMNAIPSTSAVNAAMSEDSRFSFRFQDEGVVKGDPDYDTYSWPWLLSSDKSYLYASNANMHYSYATVYADFSAEANEVLCFDYKIGSEEDGDILYVLVDGVPVYQLSGYYSQSWQTCYAYVVPEVAAGKHELTLLFLKDTATTAYEDVVQVKNFRFTTVDAIQNDPNVNANIFTYAATVLNTDENAKTQFKYYIDPVYNEEDSYYHVGSKDGPILFANIMLTSNWSETSVWLLAYNDYIVDEYGLSYSEAIEPYAWEANNNILVSGMYGYTPVTQELRQLLDLTVRNVKQYKLWDGEYHENEWLELCSYYDHYGATPQMADPMKGISFSAAIPMQEGKNEINVPFAMTPRGFKYKFTPTRSGAYKVYSTGESDPYVFLASQAQVDAHRRTHEDLQFLGIWNDKYFTDNTSGTYDGNFEFYWYFEKGENYYMLFTTFLDQVATYNVTIEYIGESYASLAPAATEYRGQDAGSIYVADAIEYTYCEEDGYYHALNNDGSMGGIIYLDVIHTTYFWPSNSIYNCLESMKDKNGDFKDAYASPEKRPFYYNGVDYTEVFDDYAFRAMQNDGELNGFVPVDKTLYEALVAFTSTDADGELPDEWLMLCYYMQQIGPAMNA